MHSELQVCLAWPDVLRTGAAPRPGDGSEKDGVWAGPGSAQACGGRGVNLPGQEAWPVHTGHRRPLGTLSCSLLPSALFPRVFPAGLS